MVDVKWEFIPGKAGVCQRPWLGRGRDCPGTAIAAGVGTVTVPVEQTHVRHLVWYHLPFCSEKQNVISVHNMADIKCGIWSRNGEVLFSLCLAL